MPTAVYCSSWHLSNCCLINTLVLQGVNSDPWDVKDAFTGVFEKISLFDLFCNKIPITEEAFLVLS